VSSIRSAPAGPVRLPNGQFIGQPGSNGGVHRGRDRFPRRNVIRAQYIHALAAAKRRPTIDPNTGKLARDAQGKIVLADVPEGKMLDDNVIAYQLIAEAAALGHDLGLNTFLRMQHDAHDIMQDAKGEKPQEPRPVATNSASALIVFPSPIFYREYRRLGDLAAKHRLPAIYAFRDAVDAGGLMSYGTSIPELFGRAATFVDKILKGAKPADLPVEQPTKFELVINLKTAKALDLTILPSLLARADQVIE